MERALALNSDFHLMANPYRNPRRMTIEELMPFIERLGDAKTVLRAVRDVEVEYAAPVACEYTVIGGNRYRAAYSYPQPHPPLITSVRSLDSDFDYLIKIEVDYGDHKERLYIDYSLFCHDDDVDAHTMMLAMIAGARHYIQEMLNRSTESEPRFDARLLPAINFDGRRISSCAEYTHFVELGSYPRGPLRAMHEFTLGSREYERVAHPRSREGLSSFMREYMGEWEPQHPPDPEHDYIVGVDFAAQGADTTVITNGNGERVQNHNRYNIVIEPSDMGRLASQARELFERQITEELVAFPYRAGRDDIWYDDYGYGKALRATNEDGMWFDDLTIDREADERAERLLLAHLTDEQKSEYIQNKSVTLKARSGRKYTISRKRTYNVVQYDASGQKPERKLCVVPDSPYRVPIADVMLMQMVLISNDEKSYLDTANKYRIDGQGE